MKLLSWLRRKPTDPISQPAVSERRLSYQCAVVQEIGARENQEDAWVLYNASDVTRIRMEGLLAVVADGMGGLERGEIASQLGVRIITEDFLHMDRGIPLEEQLRQSVNHSAEVVYDAMQGTGGSTVIACIVYDGQLFYAGLGDSFLYLLRHGNLIKISAEQNMRHQHYLRCIRDGCVDVSAHHDIVQANAVTGFMGADVQGDVDRLCRSLPLQDDDVLLLCTDGVTGALESREIAQCLNCPDANEAAARLRGAVISKNYLNQDNFTAVIIRCRK